MNPNTSYQTIHGCIYTLHLRAYYTGQALFQLKFGSVHHFSNVIFQVSPGCMHSIQYAMGGAFFGNSTVVIFIATVLLRTSWGWVLAWVVLGCSLGHTCWLAYLLHHRLLKLAVSIVPWPNFTTWPDHCLFFLYWTVKLEVAIVDQAVLPMYELRAVLLQWPGSKRISAAICSRLVSTWSYWDL